MGSAEHGGVYNFWKSFEFHQILALTTHNIEGLLRLYDSVVVFVIRQDDDLQTMR